MKAPGQDAESSFKWTSKDFVTPKSLRACRGLKVMSLPILNCAEKNAGFSKSRRCPWNDVHGSVRTQEQGIGIRTLLRGVRARFRTLLRKGPCESDSNGRSFLSSYCEAQRKAVWCVLVEPIMVEKSALTAVYRLYVLMLRCIHLANDQTEGRILGTQINFKHYRVSLQGPSQLIVSQKKQKPQAMTCS